MWETPYYTFHKKVYTDKKRKKTSSLIIDVTGSAPTMDVPGDQLVSAFSVLTKGKSPQKTKILDIGAAKLRNTIYLLKKGFQVYAVEFKELVDRMPQAKDKWNEAEKYPNFKKVTFPKDFYKLKKGDIDIILLINVINVMPIPNERLMLLSLCREKIKKDGILLWYHWRATSINPEEYTQENKLNDGFFKGRGRKYKTFYGEWDREYVLEMLNSTGFKINKTIYFDNVGNNQAYAFSPNAFSLVRKYLEASGILKARKPTTSLAEVEKINFLPLYLQELKKVPPGKQAATVFHHLVARLLDNIFIHQFKNMEIEKEIFTRFMRIDIKFQNRNKEGFLKDLRELRDFSCPSVFVECKNYKSDVGNPEYDQLSGRLSKRLGQVGFLVCPSINNKNGMLRHCKIRYEKGECIIVLDLKDIENLVRLRVRDDYEAIDDYVLNKVEVVANF
ncbi:MAG: class I SAM-dependent methyltransferase [Candidatus Omnitrophota bacterium]